MSRQNKKSLHTQVYEALQSKTRFGHSKHTDKALGVSRFFIYSFSTMRTYLKHCHYFVEWCKGYEKIKTALGHRPRTLEECEPYVPDWIAYQEGRGLSAYTVKMELSALEKLYGKTYDIKTKATRRADIKRSRGEAVRDKHFSEEKNRGFVAFCRCTGVRRAEYEKVKPSDLSIGLGGQAYLTITGKGGRTRKAPIVGTAEEIRLAMEHLKTLAGNNHAPTNADIHSYRADYATKVYEQAREHSLEALKGSKINYTALTGKTGSDGRSIYKSALYVCRGDRKGVILDRQAMIRASQALGHNRESVVGEHYIRTDHLT